MSDDIYMAFKQAITDHLKDTHTALPGIIVDFNPAKQTASVQVAIKRVFIRKNVNRDILSPVPLPLLINVPVAYPRGGGFSLTMPVKKDDECLLVFAERSIDTWHEFGGVQDPGKLRKRFHDLSDAIAYVGVSSSPNKVPNYDPDNVVLKKDDDSVYIKLKSNSDLDLHSDGNLNATVGGNATVAVEGSLDATVGGQMDVTVVGVATINAPTINLIGNVNIVGNITSTGAGGGTGTAVLKANIETEGTLKNNSVNVGSTHVHAQSPDSANNTEENTEVPQ